MDDRLRAAQRWLVRIYDEATRLMEASTDIETGAAFSRLRQMALEGLDNPQADKLERIREGVTEP